MCAFSWSNFLGHLCFIINIDMYITTTIIILGHVRSNDGIKVLLEFLKEIYDDDMADSFDKYVQFKNLKRKENENIQTFIP